MGSVRLEVLTAVGILGYVPVCVRSMAADRLHLQSGRINQEGRHIRGDPADRATMCCVGHYTFLYVRLSTLQHREVAVVCQ
jgi:hypothetical protein